MSHIDRVSVTSFVRGELLGVYHCNLTELKAENMITK